MSALLIGVDEAGRGPLAGPVAVGVVAVPEGYDIRRAFPGVNDSKLLSEGKREELYALLVQKAAAGEVRFCVRYSAAVTIDKFGLTRAVRNAVWSGVRALAPEPLGVRVLLDGLLKAPPRYAQQTIVRGDQTEPVISLASIAAKVKRDRLMKLLAKQYPEYGFEQHKGYGTPAHYERLREHGLSDLHRRSFCRDMPDVV